MIRRFLDRTEAGQELARAMRHYRGQDNLIVLGLPRGGVPVAYEVARALAAPLDICVVRKLGVPGQEELAMGAIASGDVFVLNPELVKALRVSDELIEEAVAVEKRELQRREVAYRGDQPAMEVSGSVVVLVDDGLATGATMRAAIRAMRQRNASQVIVAVPVAPAKTCRSLAQEADDVVCPLQPEHFESIGQWYEDFGQLSDDEVRLWLRRARLPEQSLHPNDDGRPRRTSLTT